MRLKQFLLLVLSFVLVFAVIGCSSNTKNGSENQPKDKPAQNEPAKQDPVEISIWTGYPEFDEYFKTMSEAYKKDHPNVTINISSFPLRDFEKKVASALPSNSAADILSMESNIALRYVKNQLVQKAPDDLAKFVTGGAYPEVIANNVNYEDTIYGVPHLLIKGGLFYNKKMFQEVGLTEPPKDMDQFVEYAKKLAKHDASGKLTRSGFSLRLSGGGSGVAQKYWYIMMQYGGSIVKEVSPGKYQADYNNDAGLKALKVYVDFVHKDKVDDPTIKHDAEAFELEQTAMFHRESWVVGDIAKKAPNLEYDIAPLPKQNLVLSNNFYVPSASKDIKGETAWDFIRFMMQDANHKQMLLMSGWLPGRVDMNMDDVFSKVPQYKGFFGNEELVTYPRIEEFDEIMTKFADRLATKGFVDASFVDNPDKMKQFLDDAAKETNNILKSYGHLAE